MSKNYRYFFGLITAGLMIAGCAKPPTAEIADAENAINAAAQAGAADFAPNEFSIAQNALADARDKVVAKDYAAALAGALDAKSKAEAAQAAVAPGKEAAKAAAAETIATVEAKLNDLKAKSSKMTGKAGAELKSGITTIESDWTKVMEDNMNGDYMKVTSALAEISTQIDELNKKAVVQAKPATKENAKKSTKK
jgi:hypothetical protein